MLTTLFGFVALLFMNFTIGADMGISLVKGILISFISVMVFFPALLLCGNKLIITSVTSYATMVSNKIPVDYLDDSIVNQFYSEHYARIILSSDYAYEGEEAFDMVKNVQQIADKYYPGTWYLCGQSANMYDLKNCVEHDNTTVTLITIISIEDEQALSGYQI